MRRILHQNARIAIVRAGRKVRVCFRTNPCGLLAQISRSGISVMSDKTLKKRVLMHPGYRGFARRPCWMAGTMNYFSITIAFLSQRNWILLFLPFNMAAMQLSIHQLGCFVLCFRLRILTSGFSRHPSALPEDQFVPVLSSLLQRQGSNTR